MTSVKESLPQRKCTSTVQKNIPSPLSPLLSPLSPLPYPSLTLFLFYKGYINFVNMLKSQYHPSTPKFFFACGVMSNAYCAYPSLATFLLFCYSFFFFSISFIHLFLYLYLLKDHNHIVNVSAAVPGSVVVNLYTLKVNATSRGCGMFPLSYSFFFFFFSSFVSSFILSFVLLLILLFRWTPKCNHGCQHGLQASRCSISFLFGLLNFSLNFLFEFVKYFIYIYNLTYFDCSNISSAMGWSGK